MQRMTTTIVRISIRELYHILRQTQGELIPLVAEFFLAFINAFGRKDATRAPGPATRGDDLFRLSHGADCVISLFKSDVVHGENLH